MSKYSCQVCGARYNQLPRDFRCTECGTMSYGWWYSEEKKQILDLAPKIPFSGMVDEFGFPVASPQKLEITQEDMELTKRFLGNLKDQTLSRGVHKVLSDLLERLK